MTSRPRVLFYSHDGLGLGHFRITLAVAEALSMKVPTAARLLITGLPSIGGFDLPETLDFVRMPGLDKRRLFETDDEVIDGLPDVFGLRAAIVATTTEHFAPHMMVVDQNPAGLGQELRPLFRRYRKSRKRPLFVLGLRDITLGPEQTRREWERSGAFDLMEEMYDLILIYGSREVFDPIREYKLSKRIAAKTIFTGYMRRPEPRRPFREVREELGAAELPLVVVTTGGGSDGAPLIEAYLWAVRSGLVPSIVSSVVAGPQMPLHDLTRLTAIAESLPRVTFTRFRNDLESHLAAADAVVTMGGYNSVWEAIGAGKRPIVVPRNSRSGEQVLRAERVTELGLATMLRTSDLTPSTVADAVNTELMSWESPLETVDFNGLDRIGEILAAFLR